MRAGPSLSTAPSCLRVREGLRGEASQEGQCGLPFDLCQQLGWSLSGNYSSSPKVLSQTHRRVRVSGTLAWSPALWREQRLEDTVSQAWPLVKQDAAGAAGDGHVVAPVWPRPAAPAHVRRAGPASPLGPAGSPGAAAHRPSWSPGPPPALQGTLLALRNRAGGLRARIQTLPASGPPARCISCPQRPGSTRWPAWSEPMMVDRGAAMLRPRADWPSARAEPTTDAPCWPCCPGRREAGRGRALLSSGRPRREGRGLQLLLRLCLLSPFASSKQNAALLGWWA